MGKAKLGLFSFGFLIAALFLFYFAPSLILGAVATAQSAAQTPLSFSQASATQQATNTTLSLAGNGGSSPTNICLNTCSTNTLYDNAACNSNTFIKIPSICYVDEGFNTYFTQNVNQPFFYSPGQVGPYWNPIASVTAYNTYNAPWLLTCPLNPNLATNPTDQRLFYTQPFDTKKHQYVAGDFCTANTTMPLRTNVQVPVNVYWDLMTVASANVQAFNILNPGNLSITNLAYSPELQTGAYSALHNGQQNFISQSYLTNSYIFQPLPAIAQNDLWTWSAPFANFSNLNKDNQTVTVKNAQIEKSYSSTTTGCGGYPLPCTPSVASVIYTVSDTGGDIQYTVADLQGLVARTQAQIFYITGSNDRLYLQAIESKDGITVSPTCANQGSGVCSAKQIVQQFYTSATMSGGAVQVILFNGTEPTSDLYWQRNVGRTIAGVTGDLLVACDDPSCSNLNTIEGWLPGVKFNVQYDLRGYNGWKENPTDAFAAYQWAWNTFGSQTSRQFQTMSPSGRWQSTDYEVEFKSFVWTMCDTTCDFPGNASQVSFAATVLNNFPAGTVSMGFFGLGGEACKGCTIDILSTRGIYQDNSDESPDKSFYSGLPSLAGWNQPNSAQAPTYNPNNVYVLWDYSQGDADTYEFYVIQSIYQQLDPTSPGGTTPYRDEIPVTIQLKTFMSQVAPPVLQTYYNDPGTLADFISAPSGGAGYDHPEAMGPYETPYEQLSKALDINVGVDNINIIGGTLSPTDIENFIGQWGSPTPYSLFFWNTQNKIEMCSATACPASTGGIPVVYASVWVPNFNDLGNSNAIEQNAAAECIRGTQPPVGEWSGINDGCPPPNQQFVDPILNTKLPGYPFIGHVMDDLNNGAQNCNYGVGSGCRYVAVDAQQYVCLYLQKTTGIPANQCPTPAQNGYASINNYTNQNTTLKRNVAFSANASVNNTQELSLMNATANTSTNETTVLSLSYSANALIRQNILSGTSLGTGVPPGNRFVRIRVTEGGAWQLNNPQYGYSYTAPVVISMIQQLQPTVLERYISGPAPNFGANPIYSGGPSLTNFLNESEAACGGCAIVPRVDLETPDPIGQAQSDIAMNPHLLVPLQYLSLDNWAPWASGKSPQEINALFKALYGQGWQGIGVNDCGGYHDAYGNATWADSCVNDGGSNWQKWTINQGQLSQVQNDPTIKLVLLYIAFPPPMKDFNNSLSPDGEANVLTYNIASQQIANNVTYVYPIVQEFWNANLHTTSPTGPYNGNSIFTTMLCLMDHYNAVPGSPSCSSTSTGQYTCIYNYTYQETTSLKNMSNAQVPFNETITTGKGNSQQTTYKIFNANVLPYLLMNYSMPSQDNQLMNQSYDVFSSWNYNTPANNIDQFPIDVPGRFYVKDAHTLISLDSGMLGNQNEFLQNFSQADAQLLPCGSFNHITCFLQNRTDILNNYGLKTGENLFGNPLSIAAMPNDYVFVLNQSIYPKAGDYFLTVLSLVPHGYYSNKSIQPSLVGPSNTMQNWASNWTAYEANVVEIQNQTTYVLKSIDLTNPLTGLLAGYQYCGVFNGNQQCTSGTLQPLNISVDDYGDVYIAGVVTPSTTGTPVPVLIKLTGVLNSGTPGIVTAAAPEDASGSSVPLLNQVAATPTGGLIFGSNITRGLLYEFSGNDLSYYGTVDLSFTSSIYGFPIASLNIPQYLYGGGLYGVSFNGFYNTPIGPAPNVLDGNNDPAQSKSIQTNFDNTGFHHPIGLQEVNGYLYVLDDWKGIVGETNNCWIKWLQFQNCNSGGTSFDILMLRALNSTGSSIPLSPTRFNDLYAQESCIFSSTITRPGECYSASGNPPPSPITCQAPGASTGTCQTVSTGCTISNGQSQNPGQTYWCAAQSTSGSSSYYALSTLSNTNSTYPPYGWVLAANITPTTGSTITFCSALDYKDNNQCVYSPQNIPSTYTGGYVPAGPALAISGDIGSTGFTDNFNNTIDMLLTTGTQSENCWFGVCIKSGGCIFWFCNTAINDPHYSELLFTDLNAENYTKFFAGSPPYTCYVDNTTMQGADPNVQSERLAGVPTGCASSKYNGHNFVSYMSPPLYTVVSPFRYLESQGASQVLAYAGQVSSSLPPYTQNRSCTGIGYSGQENCTGGTRYYNAGPPQLNIEQYPVGWGVGDLITVNASDQSDTIQISIDNNLVATSTGRAQYQICSTLSACLSPGQHTITATDTTKNPNQVTSTQLMVNSNPLLVLSPVVQVQGSPDQFTATSPNIKDGIQISINGGPPVVKGTGNVSYTENNLQIGSYQITASDKSTNQQTTLQLVVLNGTLPVITGLAPAAAETLASSYGGYLLVPYKTQFSLQQTWGQPVAVWSSNGNVGSCPTTGVFPEQGTSTTVSNTLFSDTLANGNSNLLLATIEGGSTFLHDVANNNNYVPNLSDAGLVLPLQIKYEIQNDRIFGAIYVNSTLCDSKKPDSLDCSANTQEVMNATNQTQYDFLNYTQLAGSGSAFAIGGGYQAFESYPALIKNVYGQGLVYGNPVKLTQNTIGFNYSPLAFPTSTPLFFYYKQVLYNSPLDLFINGTNYTDKVHSLLGYQRIIYVFTDRFGNKIYAPIDADIAHVVTININVNASIMPNNANWTTLKITGQAGSYTNFGNNFTPLTPGNSIYLYYDKNLDYVNYNPQTDPADAVACAFNVNTTTPLNCTLASPVYRGRSNNDNIITYHPSLNASSQCNPPPNGLLEKTTTACNIYGAGAPATCNQPIGTGIQEFCAPVYINGTGTCTSQLGLMNIAKIGVNGTFNYTTSACGYRQDSVTAKYYGYPPPEPVNVIQAPLALSENVVDGKQNILITSNVFAYYYSPAQTSQAIQIGLFELSYNNIGVLTIIASIATTLLLLFRMKKMR